jgi:histone arginine demethylase JMJD6
MNRQDAFERVSGISRTEFRDRYVAKSRPVILTDAVRGWPAMKKWSLDFFEQRYGDRLVGGEYIDQVTIGEAVRKIRASVIGGGPAPYIHQVPIPKQLPDLLEDISPPPAYVEQDRMASRLMPKSFRYSKGNVELFIGGPGAGFSLLHYDLYHLHAFTVEIAGHKAFRIFAPEDAPYLYTNPEHPQLSQLPNGFDVDLQRFPAFAKASPIDFVLAPGEMLFVPSGWWHMTKMSEVTISVAYNTLDEHNWSGFTDDYRRGVTLDGRMSAIGRLRRAYLRGIGVAFRARGM